MAEPSSQEIRITKLETAVAHQQRDYDSLNAVVTKQADELEKLRRHLSRLLSRLDSLESSRESSPAAPEDEKPPHY
jgi:uncharacterized coiled-coil protein SlyX